MGNFYANITLRTTDIDGVAHTLAAAGRDAWVAHDDRVTMVFDRECDDQDVDALERLSTTLSTSAGCAALAVCNHDDDALLVLSIDGGNVVDRYESNPGYFAGKRRRPAGGNAAWLCTTFEAREQEAEVARVLGAKHSGFAVEIDRHRSLQQLLRLPERMSFLGYRYVARGELAGDAAEATLRAVGDAQSGDGRGLAKGAAAIDHRSLIAGAATLKQDLLWSAYALALAEEADVAERFVPLFGIAKGNGQILFRRLRDYVLSHKLARANGRVQADALLAEFLGERDFDFLDLTRLLQRALRIPPLTAEEIAAVARGDWTLMQRLLKGFEALERDANPSAFAESDDDN